MKTAAEFGASALGNGDLVVLIDDIKAGMGALVGLAEKVTPHHVNVMTKIGKGLISACLPQEKAARMKLPHMVEAGINDQTKRFTVSVDYLTTTTGISAYERSDTLKALAEDNVSSEQFRMPGHVFPLISHERGLLQRVDLVEAAVDLAKMGSSTPVAYMCEILNDRGEIAAIDEVENLAADYGMPIVRISELLVYRQKERILSFAGTVIQGKQLGRKIGFPTANLRVDGTNLPLEKGVYAVRVALGGETHFGLMNAGVRPTVNKADPTIHYEVHLLDFDEMIYGVTLDVDVLFFVRDEVSFTTLDALILQINKDVEGVRNRCGLSKKITA